MAKKRFYLVKHSGSYGMIDDFSQAEVIEERKLLEKMFSDGFGAEKFEFKYNGFDKRINFHSWSLLGNYKNHELQHFCWVYSTREETPYLTEYDDGWD